MPEIKRKGARSTKDIPAEVLAQLNRGEMETANLVEWLAVDQKLLLQHLLEQNKRISYLQPLFSDIEHLKKQTVNTINEAIGTGLLKQAIEKDDTEFLTVLATHESDLVRCWATYTIGKNPALSLEQMLGQIQTFAADKHFGVREISWLAVRPRLVKQLAQSLQILSQWTSHQDENIRRFAPEASRPRGVWCEHIETLKQHPQGGLPILEPLKSDPSRYVQDSVGNWLNDASKTTPSFVIETCTRWGDESNTKETRYIIKKAMRTINKSTAAS